jgi:hypothetical protein
VAFLGHGISVDPKNVVSVVNWQMPANVTEICRFLGLAGYYRHFVQNFSSITKPLTRLTEKCVDFEWDKDCEVSFQTLKHKFVNSPILSLSESGKCFTVYTDASRIGLGCVLMLDGKVITYGFG